MGKYMNIFIPIGAFKEKKGWRIEWMARGVSKRESVRLPLCESEEEAMRRLRNYCINKNEELSGVQNEYRKFFLAGQISECSNDR